MTRILLTTGDELEVEASFDDVLKALENAARSSAGSLARLTEPGTGAPVAVSLAHVAIVRPSRGE